jgi:hypothetical protein
MSYFGTILIHPEDKDEDRNKKNCCCYILNFVNIDLFFLIPVFFLTKTGKMTSLYCLFHSSFTLKWILHIVR